MASHKKILEHVKTFEGGYSADPVDNASKSPSPIVGLDKRYPNLPVHTYRGVTWATWTRYARQKGFLATGRSFVEMTMGQWEDLLKTLYWDAFRGDDIKSQGIAEMLFEAVWGGGAYGSRGLFTKLQEFLRRNGYDIRVDGQIGPKTVEALNKFAKTKKAEEGLILHLTNERLIYLQGLSDWWKYKAGWSRRVAEMKDRALAYITENPTTAGGGIIVAAAAAYLLLKG